LYWRRHPIYPSCILKETEQLHRISTISSAICGRPGLAEVSKSGGVRSVGRW
jgi:hypothetical protein